MELKKLKDVKIPTCYSWNFVSWDDIQLHLFCDASEKAFATIAYFRFKEEYNISSAMVMAQTHVAPLQLMSRPWLELQAVVMSSCIAQMVKMEHETIINKCHFWMDSKTILCRLHSYVSRYKIFMAWRNWRANRSARLALDTIKGECHWWCHQKHKSNRFFDQKLMVERTRNFVPDWETVATGGNKRNTKSML